jgi:hypothetical protein
MKELEMPKQKARKLHKNIVVAYSRLMQRGGLLCRQFSNSEDAVKRGGNYVYFTVKDNQEFPTGAGRFLIEEGLAVSCEDGLFNETPQTFRAVPFDRFNAFKSQFEAPQNG